ncbi:hypothetical protein ACFWBF_30595 [Streptomyces sp. NPDC060028]|uniref:hypothetical protein n=1 Tax=Streptomyces sp. NPDC060028 TaxID=3347041 RepID=UPI003685B2FD
MRSSPHRGVWCLAAAAVLAVLCALAGAGPGGTELRAPRASAPALLSVAAQAQAPAAHDAGAGRCDPAPAGPDGAPAVPARAAGHTEPGTPAADRPALGEGGPFAIPRALICVRGPDLAAPGPVELSVMRV